MTTSERVLKYLKRGSAGQAELAKALKVARPYLAKVMQKMVKEKKIKAVGTTTNRYYEIGSKEGSRVGSKEGSRAISEASYTYMSEVAPSSKLMLRLHRLQRNYKLLSKPVQDKLTGLKEVMLNNTQYFKGTGYRITDNILELEGIELWSNRCTPAAILEGVAYTIANNVANAIAKQYGLEIDLSAPWSPQNLMEIELTEHEMAERVKKKGKIPLHFDGNMDPDVWMDKSYGLGGLESNRVAYIQKLTDMTNYIVEDRWSPSSQVQFNGQIQEHLLATANQIGQLVEQQSYEHQSRLDAYKQDMALRKDIKKHLALLDAKMNRIYQRKIGEYLGDGNENAKRL